MKKLAILTSVLALTACGGGSGGGHSAANNVIPDPIIAPETPLEQDVIVTQDMLNESRNAELAQKIKTIEYVENNLGALMEDGEIKTNARSNVSARRSPTTQKIFEGLLKVSDIDARYDKALKYFDILDKVMKADKNDSESHNISNKEVKIAYSLSANKPFDEITEKDLPGVNITKEAETTTVDINTFFANIQITITDKIETNIDLQESVTNDIIEDIAEVIPEIKTEEPIDPNAALVNPNMLKNLKNINELGSAFEEFSFKMDENGKIVAIALETDESAEEKDAKFTLKRKDNTSHFETDQPVWFFDFNVCYQNGRCEEGSLEGLSKKYTDREELLALIKYELKKSHYDNVSAEEKQRIYEWILTDPDVDNRWESVNFTGDLYSLGKINGLQYSDFGYYTIDEYNFTWAYQGGIEDKKIDTSNMPKTEELVFKGTAVGNLQSNSYDLSGEETRSDNKLIITDTGAATLTFDKDKESMNLPFNNWYTVNVEKEKTTGSIRQITFTDDNEMFKDGANADWKLVKENVVYKDHSFDEWKHGHQETHSLDFKSETGDEMNLHTVMYTSYYGDNNTPTEATGYLNHVEEHVEVYNENGEHTGSRQIWFEAGFGGAKQQ